MELSPFKYVAGKIGLVLIWLLWLTTFIYLPISAKMGNPSAKNSVTAMIIFIGFMSFFYGYYYAKIMEYRYRGLWATGALLFGGLIFPILFFYLKKTTGTTRAVNVDFMANNWSLCIIFTSLSANEVSADWAYKNLSALVGSMAGVKDAKQAYALIEEMKVKGFKYHILSNIPEVKITTGTFLEDAKEFAEKLAKAEYSNYEIKITDDIFHPEAALGFCFFF